MSALRLIDSTPYCARIETPAVAARRAVETDPGWIYVADLPRGDVVKIGFSLNVEKRLKKVAANYATHGKLELRATWPALITEERKLHKALISLRLSRVLKSAGEFYCRIPVLDHMLTAVAQRPGLEDLTFREWRDLQRWLSARAVRELPAWKERWLSP